MLNPNPNHLNTHILFLVGNSGPTFLGKNSFDNNVLYGLLDDLVVYDRVLTDTAVSTLFTSYGISNLGSVCFDCAARGGVTSKRVFHSKI